MRIGGKGQLRTAKLTESFSFRSARIQHIPTLHYLQSFYCIAFHYIDVEQKATARRTVYYCAVESFLQATTPQIYRLLLRRKCTTTFLQIYMILLSRTYTTARQINMLLFLVEHMIMLCSLLKTSQYLVTQNQMLLLVELKKTFTSFAYVQTY